MPTDKATLPNNVESLKKIILAKDSQLEDVRREKDVAIMGLKAEYEKKLETVTGEKRENEKKVKLLEERVEFFKARLFGRKSERWTEGDLLQMRLFDEVENGEEVAPKPREIVKVRSYKRRKGGRKPLPADIPRVVIHHKLEGADRTHGCGREMKTIGEEVSEKLNIIPQRVYVKQHRREKAACPCEGLDTEGKEGAVRIAPMPPQIIPQGIASPSLLAYILTGKFADALPFYRQERIFERIGVQIPRQTMCNWARLVYEKCIPVLDLIKWEILHGPLIGLDETPVQVMGEEGRANTTDSYMWVARGGQPGKPVLLYSYFPTRSGDFVKKFLTGYHGYLQSDGYVAYESVGKWPGIISIGCWAHVRRKFVEAWKASKGDDRGKEIVEKIRDLYMIERGARNDNLSADQIRRLRQEKSKPIVDGIKEWLDEYFLKVTPKSLLGGAIGYALGQWPRLTVFLDDGRVPIDNNLVENAIRPFVIGRKNWLFSGSPRGADASAGIYSLIETAKANKLEPFWYLLYLFKKLPYAKTEEDYRALLPFNVDRQKVTPALIENPC